MNQLQKNVKICIKKKESLQSLLFIENLQKMTKEELIKKIIQLEAHNTQLRNIIQKRNNEGNIKNEETNKQGQLNFVNSSKRHVFLKFYYLGWDYQGFVVQENTSQTIEHFLFSALMKCHLIESRESSNYSRCGRTDKGVSAFSQVISIDLRSKLPNPNEKNVHEELPYCKMLNRLLPDNIRCYAWAHVGSDRSARFDCSWRTYKYYFPQGNLNINSMMEGAKFLIGIHDFRNFCKMNVKNGVTVFQRNIRFIDIQKCYSSGEVNPGYELFKFTIEGKGFLWHQIRCIMGVLFLIGQGNESPNVVKDLLDVGKNPKRPQYTIADSLPLNLYSVCYDDISLQWNVHEENLEKIIELLTKQWTGYSIQSAMIKEMIEDLQKLSKNELKICDQTKSLLIGVQSKVYKPLLSRMTCNSLEEKIEAYVKRRKIEISKET